MTPARLHLEPREALVADIGIVRRGLGHDDGAGAVEQLVVGEVLGALAADLLARGDHEHQAGPARELGCQLQRRDDEGRDAALHVGGAAAVHAVAVGLARECVVLPRRGAERHHVDVAGEADRRTAVAYADLRDEAGACLGELVVGDAEARLLQQRSQPPRASALHARWVDRVEGEQLAREGARIEAGGHPARVLPRRPPRLPCASRSRRPRRRGARTARRPTRRPRAGP